MAYFCVIARDISDGGAARQAVRPEHLKHLDGLGETLVLAGPLQEPDGRANGSFMVVEAADIEAARALFEQDPFIRQGVFADWQVSRIGLTINNSAGR